jgi:hypothetical protein
MKFFIFFIASVLSLPASSEPSVPKEIRKVRYQIYRETCGGVNCKRSPLKAGQVSITLDVEHEGYSWGVATVILKDQKIDYKLIVHVSRRSKDKYRLQSSFLKSEAGKNSVFSSAAVSMSGYISGLELTLEPSESGGPQTRASLTLE